MTRLLDNARVARPLGRYSAAIALAALTACCVILGYGSANARSSARARVARTVSGNANASLHLVHTDGSTLYEEGQASGSLRGAVSARLDIGATFTGHFVFDTHSGAVIGHGSASPSQGRYPYESFAGTVELTGGTSRYSHAHGSLRFYGVLNRKDDAVQMETRGTLNY